MNFLGVLIVIALFNDLYENPNLIIEYFPIIVILAVILILKIKKKIKKIKGKSRKGVSIKFAKPPSFNIINRKNIMLIGLLIILIVLSNDKILDTVTYYINKYYSFIMISFMAIILYLLKDKIIEKIEKYKISKSGIKDIDLISGQEFEDYLELLFKKKGYDVETTPTSGDFGADLIITKDDNGIAVQAKRYSNKVGCMQYRKSWVQCHIINVIIA